MNAEHTVYAANESADNAADKSADGSCGVRTHIGAMGNSFGNALRLGGERISERCGGDAGNQDMKLHARTPFVVFKKARGGPGSRHLHGTIVARLIIRNAAAKRSQVRHK